MIPFAEVWRIVKKIGVISWRFLPLIALVIVVLWFRGFMARKGATVRTVTQVLSMSPSDSLITGYSYVTRLNFSKKDENQPINDSEVFQKGPAGIDGYCYRLYEVSIGYENVGEALQEYELCRRQEEKAEKGVGHDQGSSLCLPREPSVLSVDAVETNRGGEFSQYQCDEFDWLAKHGPLAAYAKTQMILDQQWSEVHVRNAQMVLAGLAGLPIGFTPAVEETGQSVGEPTRRPREIQGGPGGYLGSLKVTFSIVGMFDQERGKWFWKNDQFYVRKDLAVATFGTLVSAESFEVQNAWFGRDRLFVRLREPDLLTIDRWTTLIATKPRNFELKSGNEDETIEGHMLGSLRDRLGEISPRAIDLSKSLIASMIALNMDTKRFDLRIEFSKGRKRVTDVDAFESLLGRLTEPVD